MGKYDTWNQLSKEPQVLKKRGLPSLAKYIASDGCQNIILMLGAGISTSAGIPDFRSPKTGLYSNLARLNLPHPEAVFEINFFRSNPVPFYTLANELYPGKFRPTISHSFIRLLENKSLLHTCFTQNIDTLERRAGVSDEKIIEAHGSFASQRCIDCEASFDDEEMKEHIKTKKIARCKKCNGLVKPDIVFFGEALPPLFIRSIRNMSKADLLIVMGTSLTVHPFASLAEMVDDSCPRVLINLEQVGDFGTRNDDVLLLGKCDEMVLKLCKELGWEEELLKLWKETESSVEGSKEAPSEDQKVGDEEKKAELEVETIVDEIEKKLALVDIEGKSEDPSFESSKAPEPISESPDILKLPETKSDKPVDEKTSEEKEPQTATTKGDEKL